MPKADLIGLLRNIYSLINRYGIEKVSSALTAANIDNVREEIVNEIIDKVAHSYDMTRDALINSNKKGIPAEARMLCYVLIRKYLSLSYRNIGIYFGKKELIVDLACRNFKTMNPEIKVHRDFLIRFEKIDGEMFEFNRSVIARAKKNNPQKKSSTKKNK